MKKFILGAFAASAIMIGVHAYADYTVQTVPGFVDVIKNPYINGTWGGKIYKMYDPYANIVCYETEGEGSSNTYGISCVSLK